MLCVNTDFSLPLLAKSCLENFLGELPASLHSKQIVPGRKRMTPEERLCVLRDLKYRGVFRIKYAVREVARSLGISEPSVYR